MASVTFSIPDKIKSDMKELPWVNWSEVAREKALEVLEKYKELEKALKLVSKSRFSEKDAEALSKKVKGAMHKRLKDKGLV